MKENEKKKCNYCKSEIDAHAIICLNCKKKQGPTKVCPFCKDKILKKEKICPNCGKNLKKFNTIIGGIVFVVVCLILAVTLQNYETTDEKMSSIMNVSPEQVEEIKKVLDSVGVPTITEIAKDEGLDDYYFNGGKDKGYRVAYSGTDTNDTHRTVLVYINEDGTVLAVKMAEIEGAVLYEKGEVKDNLNNYLITDDERIKYKNLANDLVKNALKSPSTAKFPSNISEYKFGKDKGILTVQGYVDSQNSYGATVRGEFQVKFSGDTATSLIFEGKEYIQ